MLSGRLIVFCFCAALALGAPRSKGGLAETSGRIVGGTPAAKGEFPWHVSIEAPVDNGGNLQWTRRCDGAIISSEFIITDWFCEEFYKLGAVRVVAGTVDWTAAGSIHNVSETFLEDVSDVGCVVLWKIEPPFEFSSDVGPARLPAQSAESLPGTNTTISGWQESSPGTPSDVLVKLDWPIVSLADCGTEVPFAICAGGAFSGDGLCSYRGYGAPLDFQGELRGVFTLALCDRPAIFTEVSPFRDWISRVAGV